MKIFKSKHKLQKAISTKKNISFIPTMGGLHKGHISLIKKSKHFKGQSVVSIFVNPKQFNKKKDFLTYPRNLRKDLFILKKLKVDFVYIPDKKDIFSFITKNKIHLDNFSKRLCGSFRKGHFKGVLNVVNRFLEILKPKRILLGKKDYQQLYLISKHILKNKIQTKVISCKTIRNKNGVAFSTRNNLLNKKQFQIASDVYKYLLKIKKKPSVNLFKLKKKIYNLGVIKIDYLEVYNLKTLKKSSSLSKNSKIFIAYYLDNVRLIDNI
tara:strand:- start:1044 stop:1844 length:801 start_codon:yes stop_codon:yes gene_type:complete